MLILRLFRKNSVFFAQNYKLRYNGYANIRHQIWHEGGHFSLIGGQFDF